MRWRCSVHRTHVRPWRQLIHFVACSYLESTTTHREVMWNRKNRYKLHKVRSHAHIQRLYESVQHPNCNPTNNEKWFKASEGIFAYNNATKINIHTKRAKNLVSICRLALLNLLVFVCRWHSFVSVRMAVGFWKRLMRWRKWAYSSIYGLLVAAFFASIALCGCQMSRNLLHHHRIVGRTWSKSQ